MFLFSCNNNNEDNKNIGAFETRKLQKSKKHKKRLVGKKIKAFEKIKIDSNSNRYSVYFLYRETDCNTCIQQSFQMVDTVNTLLRNQRVKIISLSNNSTNNKYDIIDGSKIFNRKVLNFMFTPIFIILDKKDFHVKHVYIFIFGLNQKKERNKFLNKVHSLCD